MADSMIGGNGSERLSANERKSIISRIHSLLYWVGMFIPQHEMIGGQEIDLRDVTYQFISKENPSPEDIHAAKDLADNLEIKARDLEKELQENEITRAKAYLMLDEICGLLRAVDDLRNSHGEQAMYIKTALMAKVNDEKRWLQFVKQTNTE
jgi:hypothetical protein